jgi:acetylornithine deacetylase/succinyl-diaminopimelate desuccinylase-like protein
MDRIDHQPDRASRYGGGGNYSERHGDVVPPGEGWTVDPYGGEVVGGKLYGRASAVSKSDFASFTFALRALESHASGGSP